MVETAIKTRRHRPIFMVDLAVPRDIESEVADLDDVFLYTVDDLAQVVSDGIENRQTAAVEAELIVENRVENFMQWFKKRDAVPTIKALRDQFEATRKTELEKALKQLQKGESPEKVLEAFSSGLTNKFLHAPSHALNQSHGEEHAKLEDVLKQLYQIKS
jgi:glutamyl-tRNA reductase